MLKRAVLTLVVLERRDRLVLAQLWFIEINTQRLLSDEGLRPPHEVAKSRQTKLEFRGFWRPPSRDARR